MKGHAAFLLLGVVAMVQAQPATNAPKLGEWNQLHIPLADFITAGLTGLDDLNQYIFTSSTPFGSGILFLDNMYFTTEVVDVEDVEETKRKIAFYPNPAASGGNIRTSADVVQVEIFKMNGRQVMRANTSVLNLQGLESGVYIVKTTDAKGKIHTEKLIVN